MRLFLLISSFEQAVFLLVLIAAPSSVYSSEIVSYQLSYDLLDPDFVAVQIDLPRSQSGEQVLVMPRAIPMGYAEVHYDRFVEQKKAN